MQNINRFVKQLSFTNIPRQRDQNSNVAVKSSNNVKARVPPAVMEEFSYNYETHNGPSHWGKFNPICVTGNRQSPVNLIEKQALHKPSQRPLIIEGFANQPTSMKIENDGHSAKFTFNHLNNKPIQFVGGPLNTAYNLDSIHFHWGPNDLYVSTLNLLFKIITIFNSN